MRFRVQTAMVEVRVECDVCLGEVDQPRSLAVRRDPEEKALDELEERGWLLYPDVDLCPECRLDIRLRRVERLERRGPGPS